MTPAPPEGDDDVARFVAELDLPGLVDVHVHFLPDRVMDKVWSYFDAAESQYGFAWPVYYRMGPPRGGGRARDRPLWK